MLDDTRRPRRWRSDRAQAFEIV